MFHEQKVWMNARLGKFTASEISKLLEKGKSKDEYFGKGARTYMNTKLAEIITGEMKDDISTLKALEWGAANENDAVMEYEAQTGEKVDYFGVANPMFFAYNAYSGGSPDGVTSTACVEVKCPYSSGNHLPYLLASLQPRNTHTDFLKKHSKEYFAQVQFNMMCTSRGAGVFISYDPRALDYKNRLAVLYIESDAAMQAEIAERLVKAGEEVSAALSALQKTSVLLASPIEEGMMIVPG